MLKLILFVCLDLALTFPAQAFTNWGLSTNLTFWQVYAIGLVTYSATGVARLCSGLGARE
jgi:hypothetical protein